MYSLTSTLSGDKRPFSIEKKDVSIIRKLEGCGSHEESKR
jgi:hypothetical protein